LSLPDLPIEVSSSTSDPPSSPNSDSPLDSPIDLSSFEFPSPEPVHPAVTTSLQTAEGTSQPISQQTPAASLLLDDLATISSKDVSEAQSIRFLQADLLSVKITL